MANNKYTGIGLLLVLALSLSLWGCDVVEAPYREQPAGPGPDTGNTRKFLIEDYTGFKCPNCPAAAELAKQLEELYPGRVYIMAIHAGSFAKPDPVGLFTYDFRTETGNDLTSFFMVPQYPNGMVSRTVGSAGRMLDFGQWGTALAAVIDSDADMSIALDNDYNEATRSLTVKVDLEYLGNQTADNYLAVYIVEDSIVQPQIDNRKPLDQQKVPDYVHDHVLRGAINGKWWGERISEGAIEAGTTVSRSYTITLKEGWRPEHCKVLAYVHRYDPSYNAAAVNPGEFEILQVEELEVLD